MDNLKSFIEFSINEAQVTDDKLAKEIQEFADLSEKLNKAKRELKKMEDNYKLLESRISPIIESLDETEDTILEVNNIIVKIKQKGYKQDRYKYAEGYKWLKERVNAKMKKIIQESLDATKGILEVSTKLSVTRTKQDISEATGLSNVLDALNNMLKDLFGGILKRIIKYNNGLKNDINTFKQTM